jgi:hypothetical protein
MRKIIAGRISMETWRETSRILNRHVCSRCGASLGCEMVEGGYEIYCRGKCEFDLPSTMERASWEIRQTNILSGRRILKELRPELFPRERKTIQQIIAELGFGNE